MIKMNGKRVCVIGAGVIGLSTGVRLQESLPGLQVTVLADKFTPLTTSDGAAGINRYWTATESRLSNWAYTTFKYSQKLYNEDAVLSGVQRLFLIEIYDKETNLNSDEICHRKLTEQELEKLYPGTNFQHANGVMSFLIECKKYLPWLMQKFQSNGGIILERHVNSFNEIADDFDVIVNCCGLGAKQLANDESLNPVRGQLFRVKAPWIKFGTFVCEKWIHILPTSEDVVIGGVSQRGNYDLSVNENDGDYIWKEACKIDPTLKHATVINQWVGLRPARPSVRLELENLKVNGKTLKIVHNYGHGSRGIGLHWGCAVDAAALVKQCLLVDGYLAKL